MAAAACACNNLRTASRAITQRFDHTLEPSGLRSSQLVILLEIAAGGHSTVPQLARRLVTDRSTMQRNVQPLLKRGLIRIDARKAQRSRELTLTARGRRAIDAAVPLWEFCGRRRHLLLICTRGSTGTSRRGRERFRAVSC